MDGAEKSVKRKSMSGYSKDPDRMREVVRTIYERVGKIGIINPPHLIKLLQELDAWRGARKNIVGKILSGMVSTGVIERTGRAKEYYTLTRIGKKFLEGGSLEEVKKQVEKEVSSPILKKRARLLFKMYGLKEFSRDDVPLNVIGVAYATLGYNLVGLKKDGILTKNANSALWFFQRDSLIYKNIFTAEEINQILADLNQSDTTETETSSPVVETTIEEQTLEPEETTIEEQTPEDETSAEAQAPELIEKIAEPADNEVDEVIADFKENPELDKEKAIDMEVKSSVTEENDDIEIPEPKLSKQVSFILALGEQELKAREEKIKKELQMIRESKTIRVELNSHLEAFSGFSEKYSDLFKSFPEIADAIFYQYNKKIKDFQSKFGA